MNENQGTRRLDEFVIKKLYLLKELAFQSHYYCDDPWFSCPKALDKNEQWRFTEKSKRGVSCTCGADKHNKKVKKLWNEILDFLSSP